VLVSFAANSLITRYVVEDALLDAGLLSAARFVRAPWHSSRSRWSATNDRHPRRTNLRPALFLDI
jgi:hypothetical protein